MASEHLIVTRPNRSHPQGNEAADAHAADLFRRVNAGDSVALSDLITVVQAELRALAHYMRHRHGAPPSVVTTDLVHLAYLRMFGGTPPAIHDRKHFFAMAACAMRWILVSRARAPRLPVAKAAEGEPSIADGAGERIDLLALDDALHRLAASEPDLARLVDLKFFLDLEMAEIALVMEVPERSLYRQWERARKWLYREIKRGPGSCPTED